MQFLQSIWLWAMGAVLLPVIIHLWNVKSGKTLKVGSIALLTENVKARATSLKLSEIILLLLRCLVLILLAFLLAKPIYTSETAKKEKGWILMERNEAQRHYAYFKSIIDSLVKNGYSFHYFEQGFQKADLRTLPGDKVDTLLAKESYWSLLKSLDQHVPADLPLYLFTNNELRRVGDERPQVSMNLHWYTTTKDTLGTWLSYAYKTIDDSIAVIKGNTNPDAVWYNNETAGKPGGNLKISVAVNTPVVTALEQGKMGSDTTTIDTSVLRINIYANQYETDARYVSAGLRAIRDFNRRRITINRVDNAAKMPPSDWLFWLSDEPVEPVKNVKNIFQYQSGRLTDNPSTLEIPGIPGDGTGLYKTIEPQVTDRLPGRILWMDGFGKSILDRKGDARGVYRFNSRFDPAWNDLAWSEHFPLVLYNLLFEEDVRVMMPHKDLRTIDPQQLQPDRLNTRVFAKEDLVETMDLSKICWILAFLLFFLERLIVYRTGKRIVYG